MNKEVRMNTLAEDINSQINAGRETIRRSLREGQATAARLPRVGYVAAGLLACGVALGIGWMVYRRRRRPTLVQRLQDVMPERVRDLPDSLRAQVRKVRAV
jgi:hypothetical protein